MRDLRQREFAEKWLESKWGILNLCPRFGKCRTAILALEQIEGDIVIFIPNNELINSWKNEFKEMEFNEKRVQFVNFSSIKKFKDTCSRYIVDEMHKLSEAQSDALCEIIKDSSFLGLTGTLSEKSEKKFKDIGIPVIAKYPMNQAIQEGVISDYQITIHETKLDNTIKNKYGRFLRTEKQQFDIYSKIIDKMDSEGKDTKFMRLNRMRLIQNSYAKLNKTSQLLTFFKEHRTLVFGGTISSVEKLGISTFHSRSSSDKDFKSFCEGHSSHSSIGLVQIGSVGITVKNLNKLIINYFSSNPEDLAQKINRAMAFEYNNPNKIADIHIICTDEPVEKRWLNRALEFFDKEKITYL